MKTIMDETPYQSDQSLFSVYLNLSFASLVWKTNVKLLCSLLRMTAKRSSTTAFMSYFGHSTGEQSTNAKMAITQTIDGKEVDISQEEICKQLVCYKADYVKAEALHAEVTR